MCNHAKWLLHFFRLHVLYPSIARTIYTGYYVFFVSAALINTYDGVMKGYMKRCFPAVANSLKPKRAGAKDVEEKNSLQFNIMVALFKAFNWFVIYFAMNYLGAAFVLLELQPAMNLYRSVYFVGHFVILFMIVLVKVMAILTPRAASAEKKKQ